MATASKRLTRKQIREPDKFLVWTQQALDFVRDHRPLIIACTVALVLLVVGFGGWRLYKSSYDNEAAQSFDQAIALYRAEKYREAIPAFEKVQSFRWSRYAKLASFYEADTYITLKNPDKALSAAQRFVNATEANSLYRQMALVTLAYIEELKGQCPQAIQHYVEAQKITGPYKDRALIGSAGCYAQTGNNKAAIADYRQYLSDNPGAANTTFITLQIAELESKTAAAPTAK